jgi:hypothetical protein
MQKTCQTSIKNQNLVVFLSCFLRKLQFSYQQISVDKFLLSNHLKDKKMLLILLFQKMTKLI